MKVSKKCSTTHTIPPKLKLQVINRLGDETDMGGPPKHGLCWNKVKTGKYLPRVDLSEFLVFFWAQHWMGYPPPTPPLVLWMCVCVCHQESTWIPLSQPLAIENLKLVCVYACVRYIKSIEGYVSRKFVIQIIHSVIGGLVDEW